MDPQLLQGLFYAETFMHEDSQHGEAEHAEV